MIDPAEGTHPLEGDIDGLLAAAERAPDASALAAIVHALGRAKAERARPLLLRLADEADDDVRLAAVQRLPSTTQPTDVEAGIEADPDVVARLVASSRDLEAPIRDWATFGLGRLRAVGGAVDDALLDRATDPHPDTRAEALIALAERRDPRVLRHLLRELAETRPGTLVLRAAARLADPALHEALLTVQAGCPDDDLDDPASYGSVARRAAQRCDPSAGAEAEQIEVGLLASLEAVALDTPAESGDATERVEVSLLGAYPTTQVVFTLGDRKVRSPIWDFDEDDPSSPATIDHAFTLFRLRNAGNRL